MSRPTGIGSGFPAKLTWIERIRAAEARGMFTQEDRNLAQSWVTCACGQQDPRIPRHKEAGDYISIGEPKDAELARLGMQFAGDVEDDEIDLARITLDLIEHRAREILKALHAR